MVPNIIRIESRSYDATLFLMVHQVYCCHLAGLLPTAGCCSKCPTFYASQAATHNPTGSNWLLPTARLLLSCRPAADSVVLLKVPNILRIEPRPYDPALFEEGAEEIMDPNTGVVKTRPRDINVVRWRLK